tara:strand:+ start:1127 stop:1330 length:204 start_codon:yes stop_codon:yes gene_type:complete
LRVADARFWFFTESCSGFCGKINRSPDGRKATLGAYRGLPAGASRKEHISKMPKGYILGNFHIPPDY